MLERQFVSKLDPEINLMWIETHSQLQSQMSSSRSSEGYLDLSVCRGWFNSLHAFVFADFTDQKAITND